MLKDLVLKNRSYRGFDEKRSIQREELEDMIEHARLCASSVNRQPLKYFLAYEKEIVDQIQPLTLWAKALKMQLPHEGHCPTAFIIICQDTNISTALDAFSRDVGIVAQTMLLRAVEMDLGGCMIGSFDKQKLHDVLQLPNHIVPLLTVAIGKPDETIILEETEGLDTTYHRDENDVHYVPKRRLSDILINNQNH